MNIIKRSARVADTIAPWLDDRQVVTANVIENREIITIEYPDALNIDGAARGAATWRGDRIAHEKLAKFSDAGYLGAGTLGGGKDLTVGDPTAEAWFDRCAAVLRGDKHAAIGMIDPRAGATFIRSSAGRIHVGYSAPDGFGATDVLLGNALVATQDGYVGVGVAMPSTPLHVSGPYPQFTVQNEDTEEEATIGIEDDGQLRVSSPRGFTRVPGQISTGTLRAGGTVVSRTHTSSLLLDKIMSLNGSILVGASSAYLAFACNVPAMVQRSNPFVAATQTAFVVGVDERVDEPGVQLFDVGASIRFYWLARTAATTSSLVYVEATVTAYMGRDVSDPLRALAFQNYEVRVTSYPPYSDSYSSPNLYAAFTLPEGVMVIQATADAEITSRIAGKPLVRVGTTYIGWDGGDLIGGIKGTYARSSFQFGTTNQDGHDDYMRFADYISGNVLVEAISHYGLGATAQFRLGSSSNAMLSYQGAGSLGFEVQSLVITDAVVKTAPSTTGGAGLRVPNGVPPTSPIDGEVWRTIYGMYWRDGGATRKFATDADIATAVLKDGITTGLIGAYQACRIV